jgi:hypothetical protein
MSASLRYKDKPPWPPTPRSTASTSPKGCFWADVRKQSVDIGTALNTSFRAIEDANPRLKGVFQDVDFANRERFPDRLLDLPCSSTSRSTGCARPTWTPASSATPTST